MNQGQKGMLEKLRELEKASHKYYGPNEVYHYTSVGIVDSIITQSGIRFKMSHIANQKDQDEGGMTIVKYYHAAVENLFDRGIVSSKMRDYLKNIKVPERKVFLIKNALSPMGGQLVKEEYDTYITCFSKIGNSNEMFHEYVHSDDKKGYSLCMRVGALTKNLAIIHRFVDAECIFAVQKVVYGQDIIVELSAFLAELAKIINPFDEDHFRKYGEAILISKLSTMRESIKEEQYRKENEVRMLLYVPINTKLTETWMDYEPTAEGKKENMFIDYPKQLWGRDLIPSPQIEGNEFEMMKKRFESRGYQFHIEDRTQVKKYSKEDRYIYTLASGDS